MTWMKSTIDARIDKIADFITDNLNALETNNQAAGSTSSGSAPAAGNIQTNTAVLARISALRTAVDASGVRFTNPIVLVDGDGDTEMGG
jgi:hypothetical protein